MHLTLVVSNTVVETAQAVGDNSGDVAAALGQVNTWWLLIGSFVPFVLARIVNPKARSMVKFAISMGMSVAAALMIMVPQIDFATLTLEAGFLWVFSFIGVVQATYSAVKVTNRLRTGEASGMNDMKFAGRGGIGGTGGGYYEAGQRAA